MEKGKILIADDTETFLRLEKMLLERSGYQILTAGNGTEALKLIQTEKPKLAFLDLIMPDMNGDTVCRFVKNNKSLKETVIIMVTTRSDDESRDRCMQAGCDDYLTKPVTQRDLFEKVTKFIPIERRKHTRVPLRITAECLESGELFRSSTIDISQGGVFIETDSPPAMGTELSVEISLPTSQDKIKVMGLVVRQVTVDTATTTRTPGMGIRFTNLTDRDGDKIREYVAST